MKDQSGQIVGTAQVLLDLLENQGTPAIGSALLREAEEVALRQGRNVLVLGTETGSPVEKMYRKGGSEVYGQIPSYALTPERKLCSTT